MMDRSLLQLKHSPKHLKEGAILSIVRNECTMNKGKAGEYSSRINMEARRMGDGSQLRASLLHFALRQPRPHYIQALEAAAAPQALARAVEPVMNSRQCMEST
jgi:hypothetical protein